MAKKQSALQEETVKLRKKIEKKFKMLYLRKNERARTIERGQIKEIGKHFNEIETRVEKNQHLKGKLQELIENDKELDEVKAQTNQGGSGLERYDQSLGKSQEYFKDLRAANQKEKMREQQSM